MNQLILGLLLLLEMIAGLGLFIIVYLIMCRDEDDET